MRSDRELTYRLAALPPVPAVLEWIRTTLELPDGEAYGTFNMGAGFALYCRPGEGVDVVAAAAATGHDAWVAGTVESGERCVILEPLGLRFASDELRLR
jgi:phosphoribosylformylglycinamidine cyclo-ligase